MKAFSKDPQVIADRRSGLKRLPSGQAFIGGWPSDRKPILCDESTQQSLIQATRWAEVAVEVASRHAEELSKKGGEPLLLCDRLLHCTSSFTGLLVFTHG